MVTHTFVNGSRDKGNDDEEQNSNHRNEHSEAVLEPRAAVDKPTIYSQLTAGEVITGEEPEDGEHGPDATRRAEPNRK